MKDAPKLNEKSEDLKCDSSRLIHSLNCKCVDCKLLFQKRPKFYNANMPSNLEHHKPLKKILKNKIEGKLNRFGDPSVNELKNLTDACLYKGKLNGKNRKRSQRSRSIKQNQTQHGQQQQHYCTEKAFTEDSNENCQVKPEIQRNNKSVDGKRMRKETVSSVSTDISHSNSKISLKISAKRAIKNEKQCVENDNKNKNLSKKANFNNRLDLNKINRWKSGESGWAVVSSKKAKCDTEMPKSRVNVGKKSAAVAAPQQQPVMQLMNLPVKKTAVAESNSKRRQMRRGGVRRNKVASCNISNLMVQNNSNAVSSVYRCSAEEALLRKKMQALKIKNNGSCQNFDGFAGGSNILLNSESFFRNSRNKDSTILKNPLLTDQFSSMYTARDSSFTTNVRKTEKSLTDLTNAKLGPLFSWNLNHLHHQFQNGLCVQSGQACEFGAIGEGRFRRSYSSVVREDLNANCINNNGIYTNINIGGDNQFFSEVTDEQIKEAQSQQRLCNNKISALELFANFREQEFFLKDQYFSTLQEQVFLQQTEKKIPNLFSSLEQQQQEKNRLQQGAMIYASIAPYCHDTKSPLKDLAPDFFCVENIQELNSFGDLIIGLKNPEVNTLTAGVASKRALYSKSMLESGGKYGAIGEERKKKMTNLRSEKKINCNTASCLNPCQSVGNYNYGNGTLYALDSFCFNNCVGGDL